MSKENPAHLKYTIEHEWIDIQGGTATCGITDHAQELLTDIVFVELPEVGDTLEKGDKAATLESVKSVSDVYTPLSGEVIEVNTETADSPGIVNQDPFGNGWLFKIKISDPSEGESLLSAEEYSKRITE